MDPDSFPLRDGKIDVGFDYACNVLVTARQCLSELIEIQNSFELFEI